jgi:hypothetical protein
MSTATAPETYRTAAKKAVFFRATSPGEAVLMMGCRPIARTAPRNVSEIP